MFLFFSQYCTRSCLNIMACVGVAHKLLKYKSPGRATSRSCSQSPEKPGGREKVTHINKSLTKPPQLKLFTSSPQGQAYQAMSLPNPRSLYFGLKPINCLRRDSFGYKSILSYNCPGEERKFQPVRICIWLVILKDLGSGTPVTSSLRQVPTLVNSD